MTQTQTNPTHKSPLDEPEISDFIEALISDGVGDDRIAKSVRQEFGLTTGETSIWRYRKRHGLPQSANAAKAKKRTFQEILQRRGSTKVEGDTAYCTTTPATISSTDPDRMLKERGLDPDEWYIDALRANEWGPDDNRQYQTRFVAKRKTSYVGLMPVRSDGWRPAKKVAAKESGEPLTIVICGDQQAPFHDQRLHALFCEWLAENKPDRGVLLGDLGDFPDISRHPDDPENVANAQECLQSSYDILRDYVTNSSDTEWDYLLGNHDERIRQYLVKYAPRLYGLKTVDAPDSPGTAVHNLSHLLRLDELGINLVEPHGTYENAQVTLSRNLAVRHGWIVRQGSGASALKTLEQTGYSVIVGHTHRQSCVYHTFHEIGGGARQLLAVEAGCMCRLDGKIDRSGRRFPGYAVHPDWQNGFATATIYPDGKFKVDLATYVNGTLLYRDQRF